MSISVRAASTALAALALWPAAAFTQSHDHHAQDAAPPAQTDHAHMHDAPSSEWRIHNHATLTLANSHQSGPRGGDKAFLAGMVMMMASRNFGDRNRLELEAMLSPDPFMGKDGYPLLLQAGETADGVTHLVDRQHPHDLFMGLTARLTRRFDGDVSVFGEVGYPGEFAFGPTAFMHRPSGENFPTAPLTHHWLDSGHITWGVVTAGVAKGPFTLEASQFTGREPDEQRFDFERPRLDSTSLRLTWRMTPALKAQASWARQISPEGLEPEKDQTKQSASVEYARDFEGLGGLRSTLSWARRESENGHHGDEKPLDGWLFENTWTINPQWMALARYERIRSDELVHDAHWVAKTELGGVRTFRINAQATVGLGLVQQFNTVPDALKPIYGNNPSGTVAFMTLKLNAMP
ncbi:MULTISPECIES: hypothetical protein [Asticcacaulis]|uniref:hypothetical protein n=1 Tax=Asticcacaulis TaxID=76890 RepID=UPI001AEB041F|nr:MULTISPECIES: hypothetical protein [Asticcacaulis]MBP2158593.1 hypothetical protein [Asticcacaulis solisilvae]MDR6799639.1 hypothetical protein [Asticcacaulis sp. BE141]